MSRRPRQWKVAAPHKPGRFNSLGQMGTLGRQASWARLTRDPPPAPRGPHLQGAELGGWLRVAAAQVADEGQLLQARSRALASHLATSLLIRARVPGVLSGAARAGSGGPAGLELRDCLAAAGVVGRPKCQNAGRERGSSNVLKKTVTRPVTPHVVFPVSFTPANAAQLGGAHYPELTARMDPQQVLARRGAGTGAENRKN